MCGEKYSSSSSSTCMVGSPPRMRGKDRVACFTACEDGITPAYAGKSSCLWSGKSPCRDHPRMCGEKIVVIVKSGSTSGSPPHMRGKGLVESTEIQNLRITPAHAGKSPPWGEVLHQVLDHPRTCGEKARQGSGLNLILGSPPHMRGKAGYAGVHAAEKRITPAHAGKRLKRSRSTVSHAAIVPLFPSVCNKPAGSDGSPAGHDAPPFLPIENTAPASPAYNLRSL